MKKLFSLLLTLLISTSTVFADIIDPGPYPGDFPRPVPAPTPEPVDDGEVVVIKTLLFIGIILTMTLVVFMKNRKSKVEEY